MKTAACKKSQAAEIKKKKRKTSKIRKFYLVGRAGIEPATHCLKGSYSTY